MLNPEQNRPEGSFARVAVVGIGNEFNGDDAAGVMVARRLGVRLRSADASHVLVIEAGQAPENITADLRRFQPQVVVLIDAAQVNAAPGEVVWIPWERTSGLSASSHSLPLSMLARYLTLEFGCSVHLLGIQPGRNEVDTRLSPAVSEAVDEISAALCNELFVALAV
ncbi:MAG TPA: hydrogenase 3 maturation endopeptidase HyCI [Anaerolineales bacterium]|jgi:hydrogenase 3 maturation protease